MRTMAISFVKGGKHQPLIQKQKIQAGDAGFNYSIVYTWEDLEKTAEYITYKELYDVPKGAGYWMWKPYYLLRTMREMEYGDLVFYCDAGDYYSKDAVSRMLSIAEINDGRFLLSHVFANNYEYVKEYLFSKCFGGAENFSRSAPQIEAGVNAWIVTKENIDFIEDWYLLSRQKDNINDDNCGYENETRFKDYRYDQSILSLLVSKRGYKSVRINLTHDWLICNKLTNELPGL
jgi:hypothetical protein